ncbi:VOC family protein [uncultured Formosa sp.]|uniref:VOC family protein n=1 Tax=uncultured Formosa sp. TaxID=255435 RepID=UPI002628BDD8|nr:VOC family protein [uncultured Formosa sp.]
MLAFEHFALNLENPKEVSNWYCTHLQMKKVVDMEEAPFVTFLADSENRVVCELYYQPDYPITNFEKEHHLTFHFAFKTDDAETLKNKLIEEGATLVDDARLENGSHLVMLRDPWGLPLQLCQRTTPLV